VIRIYATVTDEVPEEIGVRNPRQHHRYLPSHVTILI